MTGHYGALGGGNAIRELGNEIIDFDGDVGDPATDFHDLKADHFGSLRGVVYRYAISGHRTNFRAAVDDCTSGWAPGGAEEFLVTLGGDGSCSWSDDVNGFDVGNDQEMAGTILHEFGHTLGLGHGGTDRINNKPNYFSVMNYEWQDCSVPTSSPILNGCDYSHSALPAGAGFLDETSLDECIGADGGAYGLGPMDWNDDGDISGSTCPAPNTQNVSADINSDRFCVTDGADNVLNSVAGGDDVVELVDAEIVIADGPDRTCDTAANGDDVQERSVGNVQESILEGAEDWSRLEYAFSGAGQADADPETLDRVRRDLGPRLAPGLQLEATRNTTPGTYRVSVRNRGGGPALDARARISVEGNATPGGTTEVGVIAAGGVWQTTVPSIEDCRPVDLTAQLDFRDFLGQPRRARQRVEIPLAPRCR